MPNYTPIRVSNLRGDLKIPFNAYVRVAGKYILLCREGDSFEGPRLERLKAKKLQKMYILDEQEPAYDSYLHQNIERAYDSSKGKSIDIRTQIIHGLMQALTEDLIEDLANKDFYKVALEGARRFSKFFFSEPEALGHMLAIKNVDYNNAHHGVSVAVLSLAIAEDLKLIESHAIKIEGLFVGCLIHDLENSYNNINLTVPLEQLSRAEKIIYARHAEDGVNRIKNEPFYDKLVLEIVKLHEEKNDGTGPNKLFEEDIDPFIQIVAVANTFDELMTYYDLNPKDALKKILIDKMGLLGLEPMKALQNALKKRGII